ncbi:MAG: nucleotidyltransferase family protein [Clostridia bacterium]|nr:nucleotidyltransferase family protein [Clostridia bacterium]
MKAVAIICEYNPFHRGHAYQIDCARRDCQADAVICIMSELLTQRGELAIADPYHRAEAAIRCGADVVLSLPFPYSGAAAEHFATAGVHIATALGATHLHFGSECGDLASLQKAATLVNTPEFIAQLTALQREQPELGVMQAREMLLQRTLGINGFPDGANDLLGLAYLAAIEAQRSPLLPMTTQRVGQDYRDDAHTADTYASASALRRLWRENGSLHALAKRLPPESYDALCRAREDGLCPTNTDRLSVAAQAFLRLADPTQLAQYAELGGGMAQRLITTAQSSTYHRLSDLIAAAATKRYTNARLWRALWFGWCGVAPDDVTAPPAYTRLLGCSPQGRAYLSSVRKSAAIPVLTKPADVPKTPAAARQHALEQALAALYTLALPTPRPTGFFLRAMPYLADS